MNRHWLIALLVGLGLGIAGLVNAGPPYGRSSWGMFTGPTSSPSFSGLVTSSGGYIATGGVSSNFSGDAIAFDNNGVTAAYALTDVATENLSILGPSASPLGTANKIGGQVTIAGGWGTLAATAIDANCTNGVDAYVLTYTTAASVLTTKTCTASTSTTSSTQFSCAGSTDQQLAVEVATCLATATGVAACGGSACTTATVGFNGTAGVVYVFPAQSEPAALTGSVSVTGDVGTITPGQVGKVVVPSLFCLGVSSGSPCMSQSSTTNINVTTYGGSSWGGQFLFHSNLADTTPVVSAGGDGNTGMNWAGGDVLKLVANGSPFLTSAAAGIDLAVVQQADLTAGSCTLGQLRLDTGGATKELCYCQATNVWYCWSATTVTGPAD